ncbi:hypothetical protein HPP92_018848 [Vanilla planifolia]|uniref:NAD-dependent epimerase/dehydratase domain-containing protein n=1 Tax=Vanilla planifolia TaxID=51239 RepID=A0A835QED1_VANPL|nr:hypothetical protein HPP92_018848 [Vanilla planifolia]
MEKKNPGTERKVCVTGAAGFFASWLIKVLLQLGYHVTGAVRDPGNSRKVAHLWALEGAKDRLQLVKANLCEEEASILPFWDARASFTQPVQFLLFSQAEIIDPTVQGTLNVLRSCKRNPFLRRVVLTSSSAAVRIREDIHSSSVLDESSWSSEELCERLKLWYALAKTLAEKAAWEFAKENHIDLVTVVPTFIIGPILPPGLSLTASDVLGLLRGETQQFSLHGRMGYLHIDDAARCHVLVYEHAAANGRYICSSSVLDNHELAARIAKRFPWLPIPKRFDESYGKVPAYTFDTSKLLNMGFQFKEIEEMFDDFIQSLKEKGYEI